MGRVHHCNRVNITTNCLPLHHHHTTKNTTCSLENYIIINKTTERKKTLMLKHSSERKQFFSRKALNICFFDLNEYFMFFCCWQVTCLHCKTSSQLKKSMWLESWFDLSLYISTRQIRKIMILPSMLTMRLSNTVRFVL